MKFFGRQDLPYGQMLRPGLHWGRMFYLDGQPDGWFIALLIPTGPAKGGTSPMGHKLAPMRRWFALALGKTKRYGSFGWEVFAQSVWLEAKAQ